jgi:threonyl-tRNA synthetase
MAQAVKSLWPDVKLGIGPAIEDGFYYDFDREEPFTPEDLDKIESKMREIIKKDYRFEREEIKRPMR